MHALKSQDVKVQDMKMHDVKLQDLNLYDSGTCSVLSVKSKTSVNVLMVLLKFG